MACRHIFGYLYLVSVIGYFIAVFILAPWSFGQTTKFWSNETALILPNSWWYESVGFRPKANFSYNYEVFLVPEMPPSVVVPTVRTVNSRIIGSIQETVFLNKGSNLTIDWRSSAMLDFYLIEGYSNYNNFIKGYSFHSKVTMRRVFFGSFNFRVKNSDVYYLVWQCYDYCSSVNLSAANLSTTLSIESIQYDMSAYQSDRLNCSGTSKCVAHLARGKTNQYTILSFPSTLSFQEPYFLKVSVNGRYSFYFPLFLVGGWGAWSLLSLLVILIRWCYRRNRRPRYHAL